MKKIIFLLAAAAMFAACKEDEIIGQYPVDSTAPAKVSNPKVENLNGRAIITYDLPNETDLLYVKAVYKDAKGEIASVKSSIFNNSLEIGGFGRSMKQTVQLYTVDRSKNESEPVPVEIEPFDGPVYQVFNSMQVQTTWGGFNMTWDNPDQEKIYIYVTSYEEDGSEASSDIFYSDSMKGESAVHGLTSTPKDIKVVVRDLYHNYSDTLSTNLVPLFETQVPLEDCKVFDQLGTGYKWSQWTQPSKVLFDGDYSAAASEKPLYMDLVKDGPYFTVDLGAEYKLSRVIFWGRWDKYPYALHNTRHFQFWGTTSADDALNPDNWEGWTLLLDDWSRKPSGNDDNGTVTAEDKQHLANGEEYAIPEDAPSVRYFRFRSLQSWTNSKGLVLCELHFFGSPVEE